MTRLWSVVQDGGRRTWRTVPGAGRQRPYKNALDIYIEQRDAQIDDLAQRVAEVEEKLRVTGDLGRQRNGGRR